MEDKKVREAGIKTYITIWAALVLFTALTVTTAGLNLGKTGIIIVLSIAAVKSALVLLFFMHLLFEKVTLIKLVIPLALIVLAIFIGLTYTDVAVR
jgi:cytochrome c oxidase subunit 4